MEQIHLDLDISQIMANQNLLPYDGTVNYYGKILDFELSTHYFDSLLQQIKWQHDRAVIFGKMIVTKRKVAWYAEREFSYSYSGTEKRALYWNKELLALKQLVETKTGETFNSCLLNLYHSGDEGMAWHSDGETELKNTVQLHR